MFIDNSVPSMIICKSDIFHHIEPFVEMLYESKFHTCHQNESTNILVNDRNIMLSFGKI